MNSSKNKLIALGMVSALLLTGCGKSSKDPIRNGSAWTQKQQDRISRMWLPARSTECQNFITIFQNFNTVINERFASSSQTGISQSIKDFKSFVSEADVALTAMASKSESKSIREYSKKFQTWIDGLSKSDNFTQEKANTLMATAKELIYNPPYDCKNP